MSQNCISVLILDDDPDDVFFIEETLSEIDGGSYQADCALNVCAAFDLIEKQNYDVILCDYQLGAHTGIDFIKKLQFQKNPTPVILLTGMSKASIDNEALGAGASDYICKSDISVSRLDRTIRYVVANALKQQALSDVLTGIDIAICVKNDVSEPSIWNERFLSVARRLNSEGSETEAIVQLLAFLGDKKDTISIDELSMDMKVTRLDDDRSVIAMHDVSNHMMALQQRERAENQAAYLAKHCHLTGLPNRLALMEAIDERIAANEPFYLVNLDMNKFKDVNDVHGHEIGDCLLIAVSDRLNSCCGDTDFLARIGGDEFVAISSAGDNNSAEYPLAECFQEAMNSEFFLSGRTLSMSISVGLATYPGTGNTPQQLMSNADVAMYRAKRNPLNRVQVFDSELDTAIRQQKVLVTDLAEAIRNRELDVAFQPICNVQSREIVAFEALARWAHKSQGQIPPDTFISIAEEAGLIGDLGELILSKACDFAAAWPQPINVAVNVSGFQIRYCDMVSTIHKVLFDTGLPASRLEIEITESVLLDDFDQALHVLRGIKNLGVSLAMDDFGTGYSSLSSLVSFPFDKLKIDRSFIEGLENREQQANIAKTCIGLGKNMNLRIVAEGVETPEQVEFLIEHDCTEMQGYLLGKPMENNAAIEFMNASGLPEKQKLRWVG